MRLREILKESNSPGEYVYHASYLPNLANGLRSIAAKGLVPSRTGYGGPGVYFAYDPEGGFYHVDKEDATLFRVKWADLVNKFGVYPTNEDGIQRDDDEIIVPGVVPADLLELEYFPGEWWDVRSALGAETYHADDIEEGWRDTLATAAVAGGIALGGTGSMMAKQAVGDYFSGAKEPAAVTQQVKTPAQKAELPKTFTQAKKQPSAPAALKAEPAKPAGPVVVKPVTSNPLEVTLLKVAKAQGLAGTELAAFMAQCAHETLDFKRLVEFGGSLDFRKYDPKYAPKKAKALGNKQVGDGARYKGRGFIQITGRWNYKQAGEELGLPLEKHPELAEKPEVAAKIAVWFWKHRVKPNVDNFHDVNDVTKQINPGLRGIENRKDTFKTYMKVATAGKGANDNA